MMCYVVYLFLQNKFQKLRIVNRNLKIDVRIYSEYRFEKSYNLLYKVGTNKCTYMPL